VAIRDGYDTDPHRLATRRTAIYAVRAASGERLPPPARQPQLRTLPARRLVGRHGYYAPQSPALADGPARTTTPSRNRRAHCARLARQHAGPIDRDPNLAEINRPPMAALAENLDDDPVLDRIV
jgi:hypothetical protein